MLHGRSRNVYQQVSDFDKGRIVEYRDCGLSYRCSRRSRSNDCYQNMESMGSGRIKRVASVFGDIVVNITLAACIRHRHTDPAPGGMVWGAIGYTSRSPLVHIKGTLNSARYFYGALQSLALPFIRAT
ncbi:hypothetical protein TNCV_2948341 [Trichonephila clavipes]|nr:hypothetical protein TNCV_2948341 [Trichonephila clavipes]